MQHLRFQTEDSKVIRNATKLTVRDAHKAGRVEHKINSRQGIAHESVMRRKSTIPKERLA